MDLFTIKDKRRYSLSWIAAEVKYCREICPVLMFYNTDIFLFFSLAFLCCLLKNVLLAIYLTTNEWFLDENAVEWGVK